MFTLNDYKYLRDVYSECANCYIKLLASAYSIGFFDDSI